MPDKRRLPDVEIWWVDVVACAGALREIEAATQRLPPASVQAEPAERTAHIALRLLIERAFGPAWRSVPFQHAPSGRPSLGGLDGDFSLAHSGDHALIGVARRGRVGVDVQAQKALHMAGARQQRIEEAGQLINPAQALPTDPDRRFLQAWTRLEAFAKAGGKGIGHVLSAIGRPGSGSVAARIAQLRASAPPIAVHDLALEGGLFAAAAIPAHLPPPLARSLPAGLEALARLALGEG